MSRGGRAQFNWDEIKDKARKDARFRDNFIGQSVKTGGTWIWDKKGTTQDAAAADEIARVKQREEELMMQKLGYAPRRSVVGGKQQLSKVEMEELLKRGQIVRDDKDSGVALEGVGAGKTTRDEKSGSLGLGFVMSGSSSWMPGTEEMERGQKEREGDVMLAELPAVRMFDAEDDKKKKKKDKKKDKKKKKKKDKKKSDSDDEKKKSRKRDRSESPVRVRHDSPERE